MGSEAHTTAVRRELECARMYQTCEELLPCTLLQARAEITAPAVHSWRWQMLGSMGTHDNHGEES